MTPRLLFPAANGIAAALSFAIADVLVKVILILGSDVLTMLTFRSAVGLLFVAVWLRVGPPAPADAKVRWISLGIGLVFAVIIFALFKAIELTDVPTAILTYFVYPLLTGLGASWSGLERLRWRGALCALAAFFGLAVMIGAHPAGLALGGVALALGAAFCRTGMLLVTRAYLVGADARVTTWYSLLSSTAVFIVLSIATWTWTMPQSVSLWVALLALSLTSTASIVFIFLSTIRIGPFRTALIMNLEPLVVIILSALFLHDVITPIQGVGSAIMLAALVAFQLWR